MEEAVESLNTKLGEAGLELLTCGVAPFLTAALIKQCHSAVTHTELAAAKVAVQEAASAGGE